MSLWFQQAYYRTNRNKIRKFQYEQAILNGFSHQEAYRLRDFRKSKFMIIIKRGKF